MLLVLGNTPLIRASGLALAIVGVTGALRRFGSLLSVVGGLTLVVSPAFWSQTGGGEGDPSTIVIAIVASLLTVIVMVVVSKRPYVGIGLGIVIFVALFFSQIGTPRSIRLTGFVVGWLMFLVTDMLLITNPHPHDAPSILLDNTAKNGETPLHARPYHVFGVLLLFGVGVINDPILTFFAPALGMALLLSRYRLAWWYWVAFAAVVSIGIRGFALDYLETQSYLMVLDQWRDADRWLSMVNLVVKQFTPLGVALGVLGLARLARWYPPLGIFMLLAYGAYTFFGLVYLGVRREVLLMPLFIIQVIWMTYAAFTLSEWLARGFPQFASIIRPIAQLVYALLPIFMLTIVLNS